MQPIDKRPEDKRPEAGDPDVVPGAEALAREQAVRQIEQRRRFQGQLVGSAVGLVVLAVIWAISEYHNAGGWPTGGFSESSGIPNVWNYWIIYPALAWLVWLVARSWAVYGRRPISEDEIRREMHRQNGGGGAAAPGSRAAGR
jgi:hypothetical protein